MDRAHWFTEPSCTDSPPTLDASLPGSRRTGRRSRAAGESTGADRLLAVRPEFELRLAESAHARREAATLVRRMYATRGYHWQGGDELPACSRSQIFTVRGNGALVGTVTLRGAGRDPLRAEELFPAEIQSCRANGGRVCEMTWFAFDPRQGTKELLATLFYFVYLYARGIHGASDMFIEVNPRHEGFYVRSLGFGRMGPERMCTRVGAPALLLRLDLAHADGQIEALGGRPDAGGRTLYPFFPSAAERRTARRRVARFDAGGLLAGDTFVGVA